jgi:hypothetical protein
MRFDHQKAFPYPVLRPDIDDYQEGEFQVTVDVISQQNQITAKINVALSVDAIRKEIANKNAQMSIIFACRDTYYRHALTTSSYSVSPSFPNGVFRGEVIVYPFVVAVRPIKNFACKDINPEFPKKQFAFDVGEVLAADEPKVLYIDRELFKPISSIMQIVKQDSLSGFEWKLSFDEPKIQIQLSAEAKQSVDLARNEKANEMILLNSIYFAGVMEAVQKLRNEGEEYGHLRWAKVLSMQAHNAGIDIRSHDSYVVAQRLLRIPLTLLEKYVFKRDDK